jgi:hypothetical protein
MIDLSHGGWRNDKETLKGLNPIENKNLAQMIMGCSLNN